MATLLDNTSRAGEGRETGWVNRLFAKEGYSPEYQELKFTLHRKLLDRINLEALSSMAGERVRAEIRAAVAKLVEEEKTPLSLVEKDRVIEEILDEVFGLGPLEPLLQDPTVSDILVTTPHLVYVERGGKLYRTPVEFKDDAHLLRIIEDAAELRLQQTHVARMETRPANVEGTGAIHIRNLVINALRMRPDRIIIGEVRSEEALDMLQAMNTGHDGSLTTIHANTPRDGLGRLEVMVGMANANMGIRSIRKQIASAVNLFVQVSRFSDGSRRITHITEVVGMEQDIITLQDVFLFEKTGITETGKVLGRFRATGIRPKFYDRLKQSGIVLPTQMFQTVVEIN